MTEMDETMDDQEFGEGPGAVFYNSQGYPKREGEEPCSFFCKNGQCKFGTTCKWDHPEYIYPGVNFNSRGFPLRADEEDCPFYAKTQECKYGCTCKFNHPEPEIAPGDQKVIPAVGVNSMGYPRRPGAPQCSFFMKSGQCKFAQTCKFDHPEKGGMMGGMMGPGGHMQMQQQQFVINPMIQQQMMQNTFNSKGYPVRPGVPTCQFFAKTGDCKFGPQCKWDHSEMQMVSMQPVVIPSGGGHQGGHRGGGHHGGGHHGGGHHGGNQGHGQTGAAAGINSFGLPIRPGAQTCSFFSKNGTCRYGEECKWDHPEEYCNQMNQNMGSGMHQNTNQGKPPKKFQNNQDNPLFNSLGFPLRPGQGPCTFYMQKGTCSYGTACKWDHPEGLGGTQPGFQKNTNRTGPY